MTQPPQAVVQGAQAAMCRLADRNTPFIFNEWYVAAFADEVGRTLLKRTLLYDSKLPEGQRPEFQIKVAHLPTPETHTTTHCFIVLGRDFAQDDESATQFMATNFFKAFDEDVVGLALLEDVLANADESNYEISVASDALGMAMRRYLKDRADNEARAA